VLTIIAFTGHATLALDHRARAGRGPALGLRDHRLRQAFLMDLVGKDDLMNAIAFNSNGLQCVRAWWDRHSAGAFTAIAGPASASR
jgi:hypothetical protein